MWCLPETAEPGCGLIRVSLCSSTVLFCYFTGFCWACYSNQLSLILAARKVFVASEKRMTGNGIGNIYPRFWLIIWILTHGPLTWPVLPCPDLPLPPPPSWNRWNLKPVTSPQISDRRSVSGCGATAPSWADWPRSMPISNTEVRCICDLVSWMVLLYPFHNTNY